MRLRRRRTLPPEETACEPEPPIEETEFFKVLMAPIHAEIDRIEKAWLLEGAELWRFSVPPFMFDPLDEEIPFTYYREIAYGTRDDYIDWVFDCSNLVEVVQVHRSVMPGIVVVTIRGVGGRTPEFLLRHVARCLESKAPIGCSVLVGPRK